MSDIWNKRREILEKALIDATLNLFDHTGSNAFELPIPGTSPVLKIVAGQFNQPPPANPPEARVTDEMVERALTEWFSDENSRDDGPETSWVAVQKEYADEGSWLREAMRKALTAALAPQPKDAT